MKKSTKAFFIILAIILVLVIAAAVVFYLIPTLTAGKVVEDIDGKTPEEAFQLALQRFEGISRYEYTVGISSTVKIFVVPVYQVTVDSYVTYSYDGDNCYGIVYQDAIQKMKDNDMWDSSMEFDYEEFWYVDGYTYLLDGSTKEKYHEEVVEESSEYERDVAELLDANLGEVTCYKKGDSYYFTVETTDYSGDPEIYTVYLTAEGLIEKIEVRYEYSESFITGASVMTVNYRYEGLDPITLPADADSYQEKDY